MIRHTITRIGLLSLMIVFLASCSKKVADTVITDEKTTSSESEKAEAKAKAEAEAKAKAEAAWVAESLEKINASRTSLKQISGHASLELTMGKENVKVSGELKMKRNNIIQLTLQALGGLITVGRLELTPEKMMIMDNINKRYVSLPYTDIPFLQENGIDFYTFQSVFWNELFLPGSKDQTPSPSAFKKIQVEKKNLLVHQAKNFQLVFLPNTSGKLQESAVKGTQNKGMTCAYQSWGTIKGESFPNKYQISIFPGTQNIIAKMDMSKLRSDDSWKGTPTTVDSKKYQQLTLNQILKAITNLAK